MKQEKRIEKRKRRVLKLNLRVSEKQKERKKRKRNLSLTNTFYESHLEGCHETKNKHKNNYHSLKT